MASTSDVESELALMKAQLGGSEAPKQLSQDVPSRRPSSRRCRTQCSPLSSPPSEPAQAAATETLDDRTHHGGGQEAGR